MPGSHAARVPVFPAQGLCIMTTGLGIRRLTSPIGHHLFTHDSSFVSAVGSSLHSRFLRLVEALRHRAHGGLAGVLPRPGRGGHNVVGTIAGVRFILRPFSFGYIYFSVVNA